MRPPNTTSSGSDYNHGGLHNLTENDAKKVEGQGRFGLSANSASAQKKAKKGSSFFGK